LPLGDPVSTRDNPAALTGGQLGALCSWPQRQRALLRQQRVTVPADL